MRDNFIAESEFLHDKKPPLGKGMFGGNVDIIAVTAKKKSSPRTAFFLYLSLPDHRTFIEDYLKILDFIEWLKVAYPEKAAFLTE